MWILPKNYQLSFHFAQDMVASKEDLTLQGLNIESSLTLKSKHSPLQTWLRRWKQGNYLQHLFTRILKPSHQKFFETKLVSSLEAIPALHFQPLENEKVQSTLHTSGLTSKNTLQQLDLLEGFSKTCLDTFRWDSQQLSVIWKKRVTTQSLEYLERKNLGLSMREKEFISLPTPRASDANGGRIKTTYKNGFKSYRKSSKQWFGAKLRDALEMNLPLDLVQNPAWTEELMGLPIGATEIKCWETV